MTLLLEIVKRGHDLLIGGGTRIENVGAGFHTFVLQRIEQQRIVGLEHRQHSLARAGRPTAEHRRHALLFDKTTRFFGENSGLRLAVLIDHLELFAKHAARRINFIGGHVQRFIHCGLRNCHGARQ